MQNSSYVMLVLPLIPPPPSSVDDFQLHGIIVSTRKRRE